MDFYCEGAEVALFLLTKEEFIYLFIVITYRHKYCFGLSLHSAEQPTLLIGNNYKEILFKLVNIAIQKT